MSHFAVCRDKPVLRDFSTLMHSDKQDAKVFFHLSGLDLRSLHIIDMDKVTMKPIKRSFKTFRQSYGHFSQSLHVNKLEVNFLTKKASTAQHTIILANKL